MVIVIGTMSTKMNKNSFNLKWDSIIHLKNNYNTSVLGPSLLTVPSASVYPFNPSHPLLPEDCY